MSSASASERMLSAVAPRPCTITIAARAVSSGAPASRTGWPWWRSFTD
jgi:hypothetical protein